MIDSFFEKQVVNNCSKCYIKKENRCKTENGNYLKFEKKPIYKKGNGELLVLVDMIEFPQNFSYLINYLDNNFNNFVIYSVLLCRTEGFKIPSPIHRVMKYCDAVDFNNLVYKIILVLGRALFALTKSSDLTFWGEFSEYKFNPTFFYYEGKRVYPIPSLSEWKEKDNFENYFVGIQTKFLQRWIRSYKEEKFGEYKIVEVKDPNHFLEMHSDAKECAWDLETSSLNMFRKDFKIKCF